MYFVIISPWKNMALHLSPIPPRMLCVPSLGEIGSVVLLKKIFKSGQSIFIMWPLCPLGKESGPSLPKDTLCQV